MKDLSNFTAPYLSFAQIRDEADRFRDIYGRGQVPVDIEDILEFDLHIQLVPEHNLYSESRTDAFLSADCKTIRIDFEHYVNPNYEKQMRFSVAHEVGHFVLHRNIIPCLRPSTIEEWKNIIMTMSEKEYSWCELHAYEFAGRLLVPRDVLIEELELQRENIAILFETYPDIADEMVIDHVATPISRRFNVTDDVISRRIKFEKIPLAHRTDEHLSMVSVFPCLPISLATLRATFTFLGLN